MLLDLSFNIQFNPHPGPHELTPNPSLLAQRGVTMGVVFS